MRSIALLKVLALGFGSLGWGGRAPLNSFLKQAHSKFDSTLEGYDPYMVLHGLNRHYEAPIVTSSNGSPCSGSKSA